MDPECLACRVNSGAEPAPGGVIAETTHWVADHCIGAFGVGAVVVKTKAHIEDLWSLPAGAADELGLLLEGVSRAIVEGVGAERVYLTMWVDKPPHHVHLVLYPRYPSETRRALDLELALRDAGAPAQDEAARAAESIRTALRSRPPAKASRSAT